MEHDPRTNLFSLGVNPGQEADPESFSTNLIQKGVFKICIDFSQTKSWILMETMFEGLILMSLCNRAAASHLGVLGIIALWCPHKL